MELILFAPFLSMHWMEKKLLLLYFIIPAGKKGLFCNPSINQFRQHPLDYVEGLEETIKECLSQAGPEMLSNVKAISVDTTGSTPVLLMKQEHHLHCCRDLKIIPMPCLCCGKIILLQRKQQRSMNMLKNLISIICSLSVDLFFRMVLGKTAAYTKRR